MTICGIGFPSFFSLYLETVLPLSMLLSLLCQLGPEIHDTNELSIDSGSITGKDCFANKPDGCLGEEDEIHIIIIT